jgi:hypothetical protein
MNAPSEKPKLIIDEDWKSQVQREKEELKSAQVSGESAETEDASQNDKGVKSPVGDNASEPLPPPPPAEFSLLLTMLATQAMSALGQVPDDEGNIPAVNFDYARHFIDLLAVLEEKTKGNLTADEQAYLQSLLHQLRMAFVATRNQSAGIK